jgi:hypothetical protein
MPAVNRLEMRDRSPVRIRGFDRHPRLQRSIGEIGQQGIGDLAQRGDPRGAIVRRRRRTQHDP